ncbi:MAG: Na+-dependent transporters of the SNF family, partial [Porphyrobacter sp. HL-46]
MVATS